MNNEIKPFRAKERALQCSLQKDSLARTEKGSEPLQQVHIDRLLQALWKKRFVVLAAAILGVLAGLSASVIKTPSYRARSSLQVESFNDAYLLRDVSPVPTSGAADSYFQDQLKILQSETLAQEVAEKLAGEIKIAETGRWTSKLNQLRKQVGMPVQPQSSAKDRRTKLVQASLSVRTSLQSHVIEVLFDSPDPQIAADGANQVVSTYISLNRQARWQSAKDTTEWLKREAAEVKSKLEKSGQVLQDYARSSGLVFTGAQNTLEEDRMRQMQSALTQAQADRSAKEARYHTALSSSGAMPPSIDSESLRQYQLTLENIRRQLAELGTTYTSAYGKVQRLEAQRAETEKAIAKERQQILTKMRDEYTTALGFERLLSNAYAAQMKYVQEQTEKTIRYNILKREVETTQNLYDALLSKEKEAGAASSLSATNIRIIDPAKRPAVPHSPNYPLYSALGLFAGALSGIGVVCASEHSNLVRRPGDVSMLKLPELGVIPSAKADRRVQRTAVQALATKQEARDLGLVTWDQESSLLSESFRAAVASLLFRTGNRQQVAVITSVHAREGKTTVIANLGIALAETERRVLLIDADLRRPKLHKIFGLCNDWGLTDLLEHPERASTAAPNSSGLLTAIPGLSVLPSGPGAAAIASLLYSSALSSLLERLRKEFDFIIIDSPPVTLYSDARVLGRQADGVIMVVRASKTTCEQLKLRCQGLLDDGTPVLGTILNDWKLAPGEEQYEAYRDHYRYYSSPKTVRLS
jgi:capsular exopolysaccharide synthesis family protein